MRNLVCLLGLAVSFATMAQGSGTVVDDAGKPVAGAFVVTVWEGRVPNPVDSRTECYSTAIGMTDKDGRYRLPAVARDFGWFLMDKSRSDVVYAPGFELSALPESGGVTKLKRPTSTGTVRVLDQFSWIPLGCAKDRKREFVPVLKAALQEAILHALPGDKRADMEISGIKRLVEKLEGERQ